MEEKFVNCKEEHLEIVYILRHQQTLSSSTCNGLPRSHRGRNWISLSSTEISELPRGGGSIGSMDSRKTAMMTSETKMDQSEQAQEIHHLGRTINHCLEFYLQRTVNFVPSAKYRLEMEKEGWESTDFRYPWRSWIVKEFLYLILKMLRSLEDFSHPCL